MRATKAFIEGREFKQKRKRTRKSLEERREQRAIRNEKCLEIAIQDIMDGMKYDSDRIGSIRIWRKATRLIKERKRFA